MTPASPAPTGPGDAHQVLEEGDRRAASRVAAGPLAPARRAGDTHDAAATTIQTEKNP